jgi:hypothetical protein
VLAVNKQENKLMMENGIEKTQRRVEISDKMKENRRQKEELENIIKQKVAEELEKIRQLDVEYKELDKQLKS